MLVHAAASGVGTALLQLAKLHGIKTIALSSNNAKLDFCTSLGATSTVNYKENPNWEQAVLALTNGKGVEIILDPIGAESIAKNSVCCATDARWVLYGFLGGSAAEHFDMGPILRKRI